MDQLFVLNYRAMTPNSEYSICILVPTYNNGTCLKSVVDGILKITNDIIVINDGSTDNTLEILAEYSNIKIKSHYPNRGKGYTLREGFKFARQLGYEFAITIDSDGQHNPSDIALFIEKLKSTGPALITGSRNMTQENVPAKSSMGNKFSNFWFWIIAGVKLPDTQTGYRLYPLKLIEPINFITSKFEFEIEVLVRSAWSGINITHTPINVFYPPKDERITHFRPLKDFIRISILNTILFIIKIIYIIPRDILRYAVKKETYINLLNELINPNDSIQKRSTSVALGVFIGIVPIWGFQIITALALAILFKLNKALVLLSSNISIPPLMPIIIYSSYILGSIWIKEETNKISFDTKLTIESIQSDLLQYIYGSITLAIIAALFAGMITWIILSIRSRTIR